MIRQIVLTIILICVGGVFTLPISAKASKNAVSTEKAVFSFALHLYQEKEYFRAVTELNRFMFMFPRSPLLEKAVFFRAKSYYFGEKFQKAGSLFLEMQNSRAFGAAAKLFAADVARRRGAFKESTALFARIDGPLKKEAVFRAVWNDIETGHYQKARRSLNAFYAAYPDAETLPEREFLMTHINALTDFQGKNEWLALFLGLAPGLGHLYTEHWGDALVSFLVVGITGTLSTLFLFVLPEDIYRPAGWGLGGATALFYAGSLYGAYNSALRYNRRFYRDTVRAIRLPLFHTSLGDGQ